MAAQQIPRGYRTTTGKWLALTPSLQLMPSPSPMELDDMVLKDADPEADSRGGAYHHDLLACWFESVHFIARKLIAENYLDRLSIN